MRLDTKISPIESLNELFQKAERLKKSDAEIAENALQESRFDLLFEQIDQSDISSVRTAIEDAERKIEQVSQYMSGLKNFDKSKIPNLETYLEALQDALNAAKAELADVSFASGTISTFLGQKLTLPQITQAAVTVHTKASDFVTAFQGAVENIINNLGSLIKDDEQKTTPLKDLAGTGGFPTVERLTDQMRKLFKKSLDGGFFKKVTSFFSKSVSPAEKRILDNIPDVDYNIVALEIAEGLLDATFDDLSAKEPPEIQNPQALETIAKESQEQEEEEGGAEGAEAIASGEAIPPLSGKEAEEEQQEVQDELRAAVEQQADVRQSPSDAVMKAIDDWNESLSPTSQDSLKKAGRLSSLKDIVGVALDDSVKAVSGEIEAAIASWRDDNEETLVKSKRFAKKNFDSLQSLIPKLAGEMLKKANESAFKLTDLNVKKLTYKILDDKFLKNNHNLISESKNTSEPYDLDELSAYRLNKMAGLNT